MNNPNYCWFIIGSNICTKTDVKKDETFSGGNPIAKIEKNGCGALSPTCKFIVKSLKDEPL